VLFTADASNPQVDGDAYEQVLVLVDLPPSGAWDGPDRLTSQLVDEMQSLWPCARISVLCADLDPTSPDASWLGGLRVEVIRPPLDVDGWLRERRLRFSLVVFAGRAALRRWRGAVGRTQPQATIVTTSEARSAFDSVAYERTQAADDERLGVRLERDLEGALVEVDAGALEFLGVPRQANGAPFAAREGVLLVADFGVAFGDPGEEALHAFVENVVPQLAARSEGTNVRVVARNFPDAVRARVRPTVELVLDGDAESLISSSRVVVEYVPFGSAPAWLPLVCAERGTPLVRIDVEGDPGPAAATILEVHDDEVAWHRAQDDGIRTDATERRRRRQPLVDLGVTGGFTPCADEATCREPTGLRHALPVRRHRTGSALVFQGQVQSSGWAEHRPLNPVMRRARLPEEALWPHLGYGWWLDAQPLTPDAATALRQIAGAFEHRPTISLAMPVYNTDPDVLEAAVDSVKSQLYPHWQLCIVDDASTRQETVETLRVIGHAEPRIVVQRNDTNQGIAETSNAALALCTGDFVGLLDHDDTLVPEALFEVVALVNQFPDLDYIYSDEDKLDLDGNRGVPFFKPSWSPDLHLCVNYVTHFAVYRRSVLDACGGFRPGVEGSQDYDLSLRVSEITARIGHIAKPLYQWRMVEGSASLAHDAKPYALESARRAIGDAMERRGWGRRVDEGMVAGTWRPRFPIIGRPLVSILIPTRNGRELLERCLTTLRERTTYERYELVIIDNGSDDPDTLTYLDHLDARVVRYPYRFNYARQMNIAAMAASGDLILFLNNDMSVRDGDWLEAMVEHAQRPEVGGVGARLLFPSGRVQHEGVFVGFGGGSAGNVDFGDYFGLGRMIRNCSAVTAACMMTRPSTFFAVGGFDERLRVAFNDVDLCLRIRQRGYRIVYTPYAELEHAESASRGALHPEEDERFFVRRWGAPETLRDPFYNPNLDPHLPFRLKR
jgi:GT2 family glycosyltransferase